MKVFCMIVAFACSSIMLLAQRPFEGHFYCKETGVNMYLNLYEETLLAPGFSFLGKMHGYMKDGIYGTWMITKFNIKDQKATIRFSNDIGSDSQDIEFTQKSDSLYTYHAVGANSIRRAVGRKLVKVTGDMVFVRK
uniref:hypothetical protein n=1 Tax=Alloprevotella sp. TaxID=1872471 RepID=UPI003FF00F76